MKPRNTIRQNLMNWFETRRAILLMSRLDDHLLKDMGISRSEIHSAVRGQNDRLLRN